MRVILLYFGLSLLSLISISQNIEIKGKISGSDLSVIYLYQFQKVDWQVIDSATVNEGSFSFQRKVPHRVWHKLGADLNSSFNVILGEPQLLLEVDGSVTPLRASYGNSVENQHLTMYLDFGKTLEKETANFQNDLKSANTKTQEEQKNLQQQVLATLKSIDKKRQIFYQSINNAKDETLIREIAIFNLINPLDGLRDYFKKEDFQKQELASSLYYQEKLYSYLRQLALPSMPQVLDEIDHLIDMTDPGSVAREALFISAIKLVQSGDQESTALLARRYQKEYPTSILAKELVKVLPVPSPQIGELAPNIMLEDSTGQTFALSSLKGQYVLLDFWASWCRPCRIEAPNVVKAFHQYKHLGFTIYSVSLDSDRAKWLRAIEKDQLHWYHVSDLKGWQSKGAAQYGVRSIPATFLIDPSGKIIARNLRGSELAKLLSKTLPGAP